MIQYLTIALSGGLSPHCHGNENFSELIFVMEISNSKIRPCEKHCFPGSAQCLNLGNNSTPENFPSF